jgi:hypothetical protein
VHSFKMYNLAFTFKQTILSFLLYTFWKYYHVLHNFLWSLLPSFKDIILKILSGPVRSKSPRFIHKKMETIFFGKRWHKITFAFSSYKHLNVTPFPFSLDILFIIWNVHRSSLNQVFLPHIHPNINKYHFLSISIIFLVIFTIAPIICYQEGIRFKLEKTHIPQCVVSIFSNSVYLPVCPQL